MSPTDQQDHHEFLWRVGHGAQRVRREYRQCHALGEQLVVDLLARQRFPDDDALRARGRVRAPPCFRLTRSGDTTPTDGILTRSSRNPYGRIRVPHGILTAAATLARCGRSGAARVHRHRDRSGFRHPPVRAVRGDQLPSARAARPRAHAALAVGPHLLLGDLDVHPASAARPGHDPLRRGDHRSDVGRARRAEGVRGAGQPAAAAGPCCSWCSTCCCSSRSASSCGSSPVAASWWRSPPDSDCRC